LVHKRDVSSSKDVHTGYLPPTAGELAKLAEEARALPPGTTVKARAPRREWRLQRRFSLELIASLVKRYNDGAAIAALSREVGATETSIRRLLLKEGVTLRRARRGPLTPEEVEKAVRRYKSGRTIRQVAGELGSSYTTIRNLLHERGVEMREDAFGRGSASEG